MFFGNVFLKSNLCWLVSCVFWRGFLKVQKRQQTLGILKGTFNLTLMFHGVALVVLLVVVVLGRSKKTAPYCFNLWISEKA